jgi:hypothetical protein
VLGRSPEKTGSAFTYQFSSKLSYIPVGSHVLLNLS